MEGGIFEFFDDRFSSNYVSLHCVGTGDKLPTRSPDHFSLVSAANERNERLLFKGHPYIT